MQAETRTLTQLFQLDVRYVIPLYQRPYVWTEQRQWSPLWEDIATVADHVLTEGATSKSPAHFLGAIVIEQEENPPGSPQRYLVIDGQQRLTTLQLLLAAAARTAQEMGCPAQGDLLGRLTLNDELLAQGDERFKVWPTNANRSAFRDTMNAGAEVATASPQAGNEIRDAYAFFRKEIKSWVTDDDVPSDKPPTKQFEALRVTLGHLLKLVSIRLEDGDNPQVIFETLNGRGTPLIALDLLKNAVFLKAERESADTDKLYGQHWAPELDREYWRDDRRTGRLFTKNGDLFLQYWLVAELAEPVAATELFDIFRVRILQPAACPPMSELIPKLTHDASVLREFQSAAPGTAERRFYDLLELMDTTTLMPIALLLLRSGTVTPARRARAFRILESFLVRRMLCGGTTKNYNRLFAGLVGDIKNDLEHADDVLAARLAAETAPANRWPHDGDVRSTILTRDLYGQRRQDRLVMVLRRVEERLRATDNKAEQGIATTSNLTLEHVIPQTWEPHWPLDDTQDDPLGWRSSHMHKLGNLTLTTGPLNSSLSNAPWHAPIQPKDKRRSLVEHSLLKLNSFLFTRYPETFTEQDVDERGAHLADLITQIWPGPDGTEISETVHAAPPSAPQPVQNDRLTPAAVDPPSTPPTREAMRELLRSGMTTSETSDHLGGGRNLWLDVLEEDARVSGEMLDRAPVPADAVALRDERQLRWEKIAARLYGSSRRVDEVKRLYDQAKGVGAAKRSFTGRGRLFPEMEP
ncbi:DUF262 domain-containing HNH endonuclease family protein [Mycobacterium sp. 29Ha]|uniref:DUF262 domain-containing protein n=1 Tax=Mycobacterium sp. 29Ha TaxID=2939268 RepID=UPI002938E165|nr:DUF262 domain-containing HNH endonuclease family protein [Mycobacterium sp. 29Ha]MDV3135634.1 DUF262 domain-containing HNH endonuclease family protein [Mycobacterium sp. 29Ha]